MDLQPADVLTPYAVLDRYPSAEPGRDRAVMPSDAEAAIDLAREVREAILSHIHPNSERDP